MTSWDARVNLSNQAGRLPDILANPPASSKATMPGGNRAATKTRRRQRLRHHAAEPVADARVGHADRGGGTESCTRRACLPSHVRRRARRSTPSRPPRASIRAPRRFISPLRHRRPSMRAQLTRGAGVTERHVFILGAGSSHSAGGGRLMGTFLQKAEDLRRLMGGKSQDFDQDFQSISFRVCRSDRCLRSRPLKRGWRTGRLRQRCSAFRLPKTRDS
jgi:hypothetical protein